MASTENKEEKKLTHLVCKHCLKCKPINEFVRDSQRKLGYRQVCLEDNSAKRRERYKNKIKKTKVNVQKPIEATPK